MSNVFSSPGVSIVTFKKDKGQLNLATITISKVSGSSVNAITKTLPLVNVADMTHTIRQQIDSSLAGELHVLTTTGGTASCSVTFADRLGKGCGGKVDSATEEYNKIRKSPSEYRVTVSVLGPDGKQSLITFEGVVTGCQLQPGDKSENSLMYITMSLVGVWKND